MNKGKVIAGTIIGLGAIGAGAAAYVFNKKKCDNIDVVPNQEEAKTVDAEVVSEEKEYSDEGDAK